MVRSDGMERAGKVILLGACMDTLKAETQEARRRCGQQGRCGRPSYTGSIRGDSGTCIPRRGTPQMLRAYVERVTAAAPCFAALD